MNIHWDHKQCCRWWQRRWTRWKQCLSHAVSVKRDISFDPWVANYASALQNNLFCRPWHRLLSLHLQALVSHSCLQISLTQFIWLKSMSNIKCTNRLILQFVEWKHLLKVGHGHSADGSDQNEPAWYTTIAYRAWAASQGQKSTRVGHSSTPCHDGVTWQIVDESWSMDGV